MPLGCDGLNEEEETSGCREGKARRFHVATLTRFFTTQMMRSLSRGDTCRI